MRRLLTLLSASALAVAVTVVGTPAASAATCSPTPSQAGDDVVLTFDAVGTCEWTVPAWVRSARVLVVGAGGGGGVNYRGGGGAGGMQEATVSLTPGSTVTITVGAGGTGALYGPAYTGWWNDQFVNTISATDGGDSRFGAIVSVGGGFGSGCYGGTLNAGDGGSGGGSTGCTAGAGVAGQGSDGSATGGGGGAGGVGTTVGGIGRASDITGASVMYAGGGGRQGSLGGAGGGGAGSNGAGNAFAQDGTDGLGGGGGGGGYFPDGSRQPDLSNDTSIGGDGGSGVVIVRHAPAPPPPPPPPIPPGPPLDVVARAYSQAVYLRWAKPASSGTFSVTHYLVTVEPSGRTCLVTAPTTSCTVTGLKNGTTYTATVKALSGAGWGLASEASNAVTPMPPPVPAIAVSAAPVGTDQVKVTGRTTAIKVGTVIWPYIHRYTRNGLVRYQGTARPVVSANGTFTWTRHVDSDDAFEVIWCTEPMKKGVCSPWTVL